MNDLLPASAEGGARHLLQRFFVAGVHHGGAGVDLIGALTVPESELAEELPRRARQGPLEEAVLLCTCNRVELYGVAAVDSPAAEAARRLLAGGDEARAAELVSSGYLHTGVAAVSHLFRVTASLDSMVLGDTQILGQVKTAFGWAQRLGLAGTVCQAIFPRAIKAAKRVHAETGLGEHQLSVSAVAVGFAQRVFERFADKRIVVVGAGETGRLALLHLLELGAQEIRVINRRPETAREMLQALGGAERFPALARVGVGPLEGLAAAAQEADIIISATGSPEPVLGPAMVGARRPGHPLLVLDLAVPRDVDPAVGRISDVFLYDLDALGAVVAENQALRRAQEQAAEDILAAEVDVTLRQMAVAGLNAVITELRQGSRGIVEGELTWALDRLPDLDERGREVLRQMADRIGNKLIDGPIRSAKREVFQQGQDGEVGSWLARLFRW